MSQTKIGLIGGSGLGALLGQHAATAKHDIDTPFGKPSDVILETEWHGLPVFLLSRHGAGHLLPPSRAPFRANIFALKKLGVTHIIASGAVGSLRDEYRPRDLVIPDQIIDKTYQRESTFFENAAVHVEFAEPFCPVLRKILLESAAEPSTAVGAGSTPTAPTSGVDSAPAPTHKVHDHGCYVCMEGPAFSTRAESLMHRLWGGDLIGMTAMPEAKLAKEAEIAYALVALVTDYDCWKKPPAPKDSAGKELPAPQPDAAELLKEIIANLTAASDNGMSLIRRAVERIAADPDRAAASPAHDALKLAIWSDKTKIAPAEIERLAPLWGKRFATSAE